MAKPKIQIGNEMRDMTADELRQHELDKAEAEAQAEAVAVKASARAALLAKLNITEAEAQLLLGS